MISLGISRQPGAEALDESVIRSAEDEGWVKYSKFKLHLRPKWARTTEINEAIVPLPPGKDIVEVFGDFYAYLVECTMTFIQESHQNGAYLLASVQDHIEFVLSHPNGWEGAQQRKLRRAAVYAGLIPDDDKGHERIHFVTEGEASLHFCIDHGLSPYITDGEGVMVVDAGGGTIDISTYSSISSSTGVDQSFEEIAAPTCLFSGSIFVTRRAHSFLWKKLKGSPYAQEVGLIADCFDKTTKHRFRNANEPAYIKFGTMRDTDIQLDIRSGQLRLEGSDVASFFEPSVSSIIRGIDGQRSIATKHVSSIFLVGGFAANTYLFSKMRQHIEPAGLSFCRPDSHVNKAVADGAVSFYIRDIVSVRVAKYNYGSIVNTRFLPLHIEHARRKDQVFIGADGDDRLGGQYSITLPKDTRVFKTQEFRTSYWRYRREKSNMNTIEVDVLCYRGHEINPRWMDREPDNYSVLFTVVANTSKAAESLKALPRKGGGFYYSLTYDIAICFGQTELKAQICWKEDVSSFPQFYQYHQLIKNPQRASRKGGIIVIQISDTEFSVD
ncbi:uncharacterized protein EV420DRAFT_1647225 [Desarmillaria tabescens]|uniref:Actin-like ATPase domain-containing protein n=1 Tax=Armillaria tabescens TaxID=1929756 RepID=A0AA39JYK3_ARMTA|nr:uncharacterized protein EV420DRAFT_1647225 [Desarmillaria tabescens]KAK0448948.1 hypothetical protein EV420DRAFT_1647225 [Desarmillaria tabescens]